MSATSSYCNSVVGLAAAADTGSRDHFIVGRAARISLESAG